MKRILQNVTEALKVFLRGNMNKNACWNDKLKENDEAEDFLKKQFIYNFSWDCSKVTSENLKCGKANTIKYLHKL